MPDQQTTLIKELEKLLNGGSAHAGLEKALEGLPAELRGKKPELLPYSIWQLVEHIRIAQWDMLGFSSSADHESPKWPDEYWPTEPEPPGDDAWEASLQQIRDDLQNFFTLLRKEDIYRPIPHGEGQSILREALQIADHNAYHTAEIIVIRRLLGAW